MLKRYTDNVFISYDGDAAGQKANMRGLEILKSEGLNVKVVPLPEGLDPDDVIKRYGAEGYKKCLDAAMPLIDFKLQTAKSAFNLNKTEDKRKYVAEAIKIISTAESASVQEDLLKKLRDETGITYESLKRDLNSSPRVPKPAESERPERKDDSSVTDKASRFVVAAFLFGAKFAKEADVSSIPFKNDVHNIIANYIRSKILLEQRIQPAELFEFFEEDSADYTELTKILDFSDGTALKGEVAERYFYDCIKTLKISDLDEKLSAIKQKAEKETDINARKALAAELQRLLNQKKNIKSGEGL